MSNDPTIASPSALRALCEALIARGAAAWAAQLPRQIADALDAARHGDEPRWQKILDAMPCVMPSQRICHGDCVTIGCAEDLAASSRPALHDSLMALQPWRKGPFELFGIHIDSEWRSDWKWRRLAPHIAPLAGRWVLDVGCGNGYYAWRMYGAGAERVIGIDPTLLYVVQFETIRRLYGAPVPIDVLPLALEDLPPDVALFDSVFSMGVLYHRRSPIDHLLALKQCLRAGGELILETLVVEGDEQRVLLPEGRYAQMRNVWFIPSPLALVCWLQRVGFRDIRVVDVTPTTIAEQRRTAWMRFQSLADFLSPDDPTRTVENLPAPVRAIVIAKAP